MFTLFINKKDDIEKTFLYSLKVLDPQKFKINKLTNSIIYNFDNSSNLLIEFSSHIAELIINMYEKILITKTIQKNYHYFNAEEKSEILKISSNIVDENSRSKKDLIILSVYDYIKNNNEMDLNGFIRFRLKDYMEVLDYLVDLAVNNFIITREYNRFIKLLTDYINNEPSKIDLVHLVYLNQESILLDSNKDLIPINNNIFDAKYLSDISFSSNDYALNTILNLLPTKLYVHILNKEDEFIETLKNIFKEKLHICHNCDICNFYKLTILK